MACDRRRVRSGWGGEMNGEPAKTNEKTTTDFTVVPFDDLQLHMGEHEDYGQAMIIEYEGEHWTVIKLSDGRLTLGRQVME